MFRNSFLLLYYCVLYNVDKKSKVEFLRLRQTKNAFAFSPL